MKKVILSVAIVAIAFSANAQKAAEKSFNFSGGATVALPMGDLKDVSSLGIGAFVKAGYPVADQFEIIANAGYTSFIGKTVDVGGSSVKYPSQGLFHILAGGSFVAEGGFHVDALGGFNSYSVSGGGSLSGFGFRGGLGYKLESGLDITAYYNSFSKSGGSIGFIGLGVAYNFVK